MTKTITFALITACMLALSTSLATAQDAKPDYAKFFEEDLFNLEGGKTFENSAMKRFDISKYKSFDLTWHSKSKSQDIACLVYHGELKKAAETGRKTTARNIAIKLARQKNSWVVNAYNIMPGKDPEVYDNWLKAHKCKNKVVHNSKT